MFVQDRFLYLIVTRHKLTVHGTKDSLMSGFAKRTHIWPVFKHIEEFLPVNCEMLPTFVKIRISKMF